MARTWILHTEAKGTGAQMVPLDSVTKRSAPVAPVYVPRPSDLPAPGPAHQPRSRRRFKVVDARSRQMLLEDGGARDAVGVIQGTGSLLDTSVYTWEQERERWRLLTLAEQRVLWNLARR